MLSFTLVVIVIIAYYWYSRHRFSYWKAKGVKHDPPILFFGNNFKRYIMQESISDTVVRLYYKYPDEKVVGFYRRMEPELFIRDPEIAKKVLHKDFNYFYARGLTKNMDVSNDPLMRNLFFADGDLWRLLRQRMTPAFTSGKLKAMFPLIVERAEKLQARVLATQSTGQAIDARDLMARYTTDFIGAVGFGLDSDSLNDENSAFRQLGQKIFSPSPLDVIKALLVIEVLPKGLLKLKLMKKFEKDLIDLVSMILKQRNYEPSGRNDFIDLLLECRKKGEIVGESIENIRPDGKPETAKLWMDEELIAAQVFVFFAAGFETSSSATSYTLHQLAYNQDVQKKVQEEIDRVLERHNNKLSYDAIKEMTYLECAFREGMRMFPSLGFLVRECRKDYNIPEINLTVDKDTRIFISLQGMQNDPKYFSDPEEFRPERFGPDEFDSSKKIVYMPFGDGPRACIGERLGMMQSLAGLAAILSLFTVRPSPESKKYLIKDPKAGIVQTIKNGIPLYFDRRAKN